MNKKINHLQALSLATSVFGSLLICSPIDAFSIVPTLGQPRQVSLRSNILSTPSLISTSSRSLIGIGRSLNSNLFLENGNHDDKIIDVEITNGTKKIHKKSHNHGIHPSILSILKSTKSIPQNMAILNTIRVPKLFKIQRKTITTLLASAMIMAAVFFTPMQDAHAARSGGRMGGSSGGASRSRSSSPSTSRSYRSPSSSSGSYNRGYSSGYYSRPSVIVAPTPIYPVSSYGYYGSPGSGVAIVHRGPSFVTFIMSGLFLLVILNSFQNFRDDWDDNSTIDSVLGSGVTVAQISVAINVPRRNDPSSILSFLDSLSSTARTDSRVGISNLTSQVALELLRQKRSIFAANAKSTHFRSGKEDGAEREFSTVAIRERSKFERETTNKYGGVDYSSSSSNSSSSSSVVQRGENQFDPKATSAVITILISIDGDSTKLPTINNVKDLENALLRIATDVKVDDCLRSAEVLWTPDDKNDVLTETDVIVDYPELRSI